MMGHELFKWMVTNSLTIKLPRFVLGDSELGLFAAEAAGGTTRPAPSSPVGGALILAQLFGNYGSPCAPCDSGLASPH
ncbi:jg9344 [Pararge aegeria aegeria]|uniref:Jg9344 protein n=1 Tax=Pararge aegeria aegeria TaxID=348720 RepID=A0A8S4S1C5_9NEOP|nr:jg9344 [Pararge aegeria aegeria]